MKLESVKEIKAYYKGKRNGIWLFVWWKNGVQQVGSCGTTYTEAVAGVAQQEICALETLSERKLVLTS